VCTDSIREGGCVDSREGWDWLGDESVGFRGVFKNAVCCGGLWCVAVCCGVLRDVAACCSVLQ